jgi:hypothetical protein
VRLWNRKPRDIVQLPIGMTEFETFVSNIVKDSGLPANDSTRRLASMFVLECPPHVKEVSWSYLIGKMRKAASNQVAVAVLRELDEKAKKYSQPG